MKKSGETAVDLFTSNTSPTDTQSKCSASKEDKLEEDETFKKA